MLKRAYTMHKRTTKVEEKSLDKGITKVVPTTRLKGYAEIKSKLDDKFDNSKFLEKIKLVKLRGMHKNLSINDQKYFNLVEESYKNNVNKKPLNIKDFILSGHELDEVVRISDKNLPRYLVYRYKYVKFPQLKIVEAYPPCIQVEPTSQCNFRCIMCYQIDKSFSSKSQGHMGNMSLDTFKAAVDQLEGNLEAVTLASRGEPALNKQLGEMLKYANGKFLALKLNTNASLLTEKLTHDILQSDIQTLVFSADAADPETYKKIRVNGNLEKVFQNIENFNEIRLKHYPNSNIFTKVSGVKLNESQKISDMIQFWGNLVDQVAFVNYNPWESAYLNEPNELEKPCTELWRRMFLWWDGRFNPCDYDYKSVLTSLEKPNLSKTTISKFWTGDFYQNMRGKHLGSDRKLVEPCARCVSL